MATREIVELPDKHTGDVNEIRDKKIALASEATGATDITAQCEYLIKNGQTGEFMNVLKSYIDESVRSALGALVNNLDKGSSIKSVLATDSSNDLGSITPANLASVLGGIAFLQHYGYVGNKDYDTLNPGIYYIENGNNAPAQWCIVECICQVPSTSSFDTEAVYLQRAYKSSGGAWWRAHNSNGWSSWHQL